MKMKEVISKEDAIKSIVESEYYFLDEVGHGVSDSDRQGAAEKMLERASAVSPRPWLEVFPGGNEHQCPWCGEIVKGLDLTKARFCLYCGMPTKFLAFEDTCTEETGEDK